MASAFWLEFDQMQSGAHRCAPLAWTSVEYGDQPAAVTARCAITLIRLAR
jgi:hypothetical protein